ncbi:MAG: hypothetical protein WAM17_03320 [Rhodoplanes sp.]
MVAASKFEVIVWIRKTDVFLILRDELLGVAGDEPDESTDYEGMVDFHWGFAKLPEAERMASALTALASRPEVVLLRLSNYDDLDASLTFKDERFPRH